MQYGFVGLSHLGLTTAISLSSTGINILGFDQDAELVKNLQNKKLPLYEPKLEDIFKNSSIKFSNSVTDLKNCDVIYVAVDIKTNDKNESDLSKVKELAQLVIPVMKAGSALVIHSQVNPGFTRSIVKDANRSDIEIYYQVEVLIFGQAVDRVLKPERYMVGCENPTKSLHPAYEKLLSQFSCPVMKMRYESAELAKISINLYLAASVTVSNTIAEIAENIGADFSEISPVLRLDRRIGQFAYLEPGLGISGGNLERDFVTLLKMAETTGAEPSVVASFVKNSEYMKQWVLRKLHLEALKEIPNPKIGILGLAYKKDTNSIKNSPAIELLKGLSGFKVCAFDPEVKSLPTEFKNVEVATDANTVIKNCDVLIVMTQWDQFKTLSLKEFKGKAILDPYKMLKVENASTKHWTRGATV